MPMDRAKYPHDWEAISKRIRFERAGNKCEQCGVQNGAVGARDKYGEWHDEDSIHSLNSDGGYTLFGEFPDMTKIVLTVHHKGVDKPDGTPGDRHDKMDCRDENLAALCQRCHWLADIDIHIEKSKEARARKRTEAIKATGQLDLFGD